MSSKAPSLDEGEQLYNVRIPDIIKTKKFNVMKFNACHNIDFSNWSQVRMVRENNRKIYQLSGNTADLPKFGAGSAFGQKEREEMRRQRLGYKSNVYRPEAQPWLLRVGGKTGRRYKGICEGGVSANASYYVFMHASDGAFEAYPINEWYSYTPMQRYKMFNAEEAEEKFANRTKVYNRWSVMVERKLHSDDHDGADVEDSLDSASGGTGGKRKKGLKTKNSLKLTDIEDEFDDSCDTGDDEDKEDNEGKNKVRHSKKEKSLEDVDEEAFEDSDDGAEEGREVDYISDESSDDADEVENKLDLKGVEQDEALSKLLNSDSEDDDNDVKKEERDMEGEVEPSEMDEKMNGENIDAEELKQNLAEVEGGQISKNTNDEKFNQNSLGMAEKRKIGSIDSPINGPIETKRLCMDSAVEQSLLDDVKRYLTRKPMTATDLIKKFKSKKTNIPSDEFFTVFTNILKRLNPHKQKVKGIMYLSLKNT